MSERSVLQAIFTSLRQDLQEQEAQLYHNVWLEGHSNPQGLRSTPIEGNCICNRRQSWAQELAMGSYTA